MQLCIAGSALKSPKMNWRSNFNIAIINLLSLWRLLWRNQLKPDCLVFLAREKPQFWKIKWHAQRYTPQRQILSRLSLLLWNMLPNKTFKAFCRSSLWPSIPHAFREVGWWNFLKNNCDFEIIIFPWALGLPIPSPKMATPEDAYNCSYQWNMDMIQFNTVKKKHHLVL